TVTIPPSMQIAPPAAYGPDAVLAESVLLLTVSVPLTMRMLPPSPYAVLPARVLLLTVTAPPPMLIAPPGPYTVLPESVLLLTIAVPSWLNRPPPVLAALAEMVMPVTVKVPLL